MKSKKQKTVIITGGTQGIGFGIAREFHARGMNVVIGARHDNGAVGKLGPRAKFKKTDVRKEADHRALIEFTLAWTDRVDVYVNCAGFSGWRAAEEVDELFWEEMVDTNLKGTFWGCKTAARHLSKGGCIINVSSIAGKRGSANNSVYCASKFGVTGLTQALAKEFGPRGIRVNAVCPVYILTDGVLKALAKKNSPAKGKDIKAYLEKFTREQSALGRLPTVQDVARMCWFLASEEASAVTGQSINVDCGVLPS